MNYEKRILEKLSAIKLEMQKINLWQGQPPAADAFLSVQPFALDTLEPYEWLQWIFIPKIEALIDANAELPHNFALHPYFEQIYKDDNNYIILLDLIKDLDQLSKL